MSEQNIPQKGWYFYVEDEVTMEEFRPPGTDMVISGAARPYVRLFIYKDGEEVFSIRGVPNEDGEIYRLSYRLLEFQQVLNDVETLRKVGEGGAAQRLEGWWVTWRRDNPDDLLWELPYKDIVALVLDLVHADDSDDPKQQLVDRVAAAMRSEFGQMFGANPDAWQHWARGVVAKAGISPVYSTREMEEVWGDERPLYRLEESE